MGIQKLVLIVLFFSIVVGARNSLVDQIVIGTRIGGAILGYYIGKFSDQDRKMQGITLFISGLIVMILMTLFMRCSRAIWPI